MMPPPPPPPPPPRATQATGTAHRPPPAAFPPPLGQPEQQPQEAKAHSQHQPSLQPPAATSNTFAHPSQPSSISQTSSYSIPTPTSNEPYGEISGSFSFSSQSGMHKRGTENQSTQGSAPTSPFAYGSGTSSSYGVPVSNYSDDSPRGQQQQSNKAGSGGIGYYEHNATAQFFLVPTLASIMWWHESPIVIQMFLYVALFIYAMDLINARDGTVVCIWVGALVLTMVSGLANLLQADDADASGSQMILLLVQIGVEGAFFVCMACFSTLQFRWLYKESPGTAVGLEQALHAMLPPVSASVLCSHILRLLMDYWGLDLVATVAPHLFALLMATGMFTLGACTNSFISSTEEKDSAHANNNVSFALTNLGARTHSMLLLLVPGTVQVLMFHRRIFSRVASFDEVYDLILVWAVPYLLHCALLVKEDSPYCMSNNTLFPKSQTTLRGSFIPILTSLAASLALQQRYIIPICHQVSYQFNGHDLPPTFVVTFYLTVATFSTLFAVWTWGRNSTVTNELLFGEYHEDVVQLCVSVAGLLLGKAFGIPWNLTPLPILAFLGLSIWITTRMLRYLSIFLFVVHAAGVVLFSYRFAAIDMSIALAVPGLELGLIRFGMVCVIASVLIGLVAGFAVRQSGGVGADLLKRVDVAGFLLMVYCVLLMTLELTLLKRPAPDHEAMTKESDSDVDDDEFVYDHAKALLTSCMTIGIAAFSQRSKTISSKSAVVVVAFAIGKAIAVVIDANEVDGRIRSDLSQEAKAEKILVRAVVASILFIVMAAPKYFLTPIRIKATARYKRSISSGQPLAAISQSAYRTIFTYCLVVLPLTLILSIPYVLTPLVKALSVHYGGGAYYSMSPPFSEMFGFATVLWGIACLSMLNHFLPDGGLETWKKAAALTLLMGIGVAVSAPTVPAWILGNSLSHVSSPYASISSLGLKLVNEGRSRTGGWGLLSAGLATLLAVTGPLELRERKHPSGKKDNFLLLRLMIFSILFGSGVSWFITIQSMSQEDLITLVITSISCIAVSFFGTVTSVLGYHLDLENFEEVDQISRVWLGSFVVFGVILGASQFVLKSDSMHAFGTGGWLSTYLTVCSCSTLALAVALRSRPSKNQVSRGLGNVSCVTSWLLATFVLYGRFGVAGLDHAFDVTTLMGIPVSVVGTFLLAPILLALEGEISNQRRGRVARMSGTNAKAPKNGFMGFNLKNLSPSNRFVPLILGTVLVFIAASLYTILLRGSFVFGGSVPRNHVDVFANVFGKKGDQLAHMVEKSTSRNQALVTSARLAGSGIWTSSSMFGPMLHLGGLIAALPSLFILINHSWFRTPVSKAHVTLALPLNLIPIILCGGIQSIRAIAFIGVVGGLYQLLSFKNRNQKSHMRI